MTLVSVPCRTVYVVGHRRATSTRAARHRLCRVALNNIPRRDGATVSVQFFYNNLQFRPEDGQEVREFRVTVTSFHPRLGLRQVAHGGGVLVYVLGPTL